MRSQGVFIGWSATSGPTSTCRCGSQVARTRRAGRRLSSWQAPYETELSLAPLQFSCLAMGKSSQRRIDTVLKRKRDDINEVEEDVSPLINNSLPLIEMEQQQENHEEVENEPVTFQGIEFLQRDPGLRPQIWQYPPDQRDSVRRAYMMLGPMQPHLQDYELSGEQGHRRRFQYNWFGLFPSWLEYSENKHRAYCLFCFVSGKKENTRGGSNVFTVDGFDSWKRVNSGKHCAFLTHIGSGPCSSHGCAFSNMKIIKTRLRNKMEDDNLANNLLVHIECDILEDYNYDDVISDFKSIKDRAADL